MQSSDFDELHKSKKKYSIKQPVCFKSRYFRMKPKLHWWHQNGLSPVWKKKKICEQELLMILALGTVTILLICAICDHARIKMGFAHTDLCECIYVCATCMDCQKLPYSAGRHVILSWTSLLHPATHHPWAVTIQMRRKQHHCVSYVHWKYWLYTGYWSFAVLLVLTFPLLDKVQSSERVI